MNWYMLSFTCALSLATADAFTKKFFHNYNGWELLIIRIIVPAVLLAPLMTYYPLPKIPPEFWVWMAILVPAEIFAMLLYLIAIRDSPLHLTLPYLAFTPVFNVATGYLVLGESVSTQGLLGIILVVCGAYLLNLHRLKGNNNYLIPLTAIAREKGSRLMLLVAAIYSFTSVISKGAMQFATPASFGVFYFIPIAIALFAITAIYQPAALRVLFRQPAKNLFIGSLMAAMIVTHFLAISMTEVAYMIAVKRTSLLFGIIWGALLFKENRLGPHLLAGTLMVTGVALILI
jgi:uncharacterized membrane protein